MRSGYTQGEPSSPMIFNILVDVVVRAVLEEVCGPHEAHHWMGWEVGERNLVFYADGGQILGRNPYWLHKELETTIEMFIRVGMEKNLEKTKAMVFTPGLI